LTGFALLLFAGGCVGTCGHSGDDPAEVARTTLTKVGQAAPAFTADLIGGGTFDLASQRGKVVLVNFFATWCPPCREEMPHLQKQVWERFQGDGFAMISVAREETPDVVEPFIAKHGAGWAFALDPDRSVFAAYAEAYIPRNYVVDRDGHIAYQSSGYDKKDFAAMIDVIARELARPAE
jgi:peroxiredoxin